MFKSEKGVSAVEFALIAPILFVLTFGIIEFSILLFDKAVVTNASREGARAAIIYNVIDNGDGTTTYDPPSKESISTVVKKYTDTYLISLGGGSGESTTSVEYKDLDGGTTAASGGDVIVTTSYNYNFLVFQSLIGLLGGTEYEQGFPLQGRTVMRME